MKLNIPFLVFLVILINSTLAYENGYGANECGKKYNPNVTVPCKELYDIFHRCAGIFIEKALHNAAPFELCTSEQSYQSYRNLVFFLNVLQTTQDPDNHNSKCVDKYVNQNSMGVVSKVVTLSKNLWENAHCDDCYVNTSSVNQTFSANTINFFNLTRKYKDCVEINKKNYSNICENCEPEYSQMNIIFNHHKEESEGKICFDLEDIMNQTRYNWSTKYKCCQDKKDSLTAFFGLFSTIMSLALVFYLTIYFVGSRYSDVETIDSNNIGHHPANTSTSSSASSSVPSSSSGSGNVKRKKQPKVVSINNDNSDDDEPIINNNLIQLAD